MGTLSVQTAANADTTAPSNRFISAWAQDTIHKATLYKRRHHSRRHHYGGYDRYDRYERRHYRKRHLRRNLRRFRRFLRHRFHDRDWDYRRHHYRHWD
jgi:hypothetical protein